MRSSSLLVAGVVLLACTVLALVSLPAGGALPALVPDLPAWAVIAGWTALALALIGSAVWAAVDALLAHRVRRAGDEHPTPVRLWPLFLASAAALAVVLVLAALALSFLKPPEEESGPAALAGVEGEAEEEPAPEEEERESRPVDPRIVAAVLLAAAGAATAVALALLARRLRRDRAGPAAVSEEARQRLRREIAAGLRLSLAEILAEPDCRRAVIACYARMEQSFALAGLPRGGHETPLEFLGRVLPRLRLVTVSNGSSRVDRALEDLTGLYEVARFSEHPVGPAERRRAVASIRVLDAALAEPVGGDAKEDAW